MAAVIPLNGRVQVTAGTGTVRFVGQTAFAAGKWVGIQLDEPTGKNDGSVAGTRYFTCADGYGVFVRASMVSVLDQGGPVAEQLPHGDRPASRASTHTAASSSRPPTRPASSASATTRPRASLVPATSVPAATPSASRPLSAASSNASASSSVSRLRSTSPTKPRQSLVPSAGSSFRPASAASQTTTGAAERRTSMLPPPTPRTRTGGLAPPTPRSAFVRPGTATTGPTTPSTAKKAPPANFAPPSAAPVSPSPATGSGTTPRPARPAAASTTSLASGGRAGLARPGGPGSARPIGLASRAPAPTAGATMRRTLSSSSNLSSTSSVASSVASTSTASARSESATEDEADGGGSAPGNFVGDDQDDDDSGLGTIRATKSTGQAFQKASILPTAASDPFSLRNTEQRRPLEATVPQRAYDELAAKLSIVERRRAEDRDKLRDLDRLIEEQGEWNRVKEKTKARVAELTGEVKELKRENKDLLAERDSVQSKFDDLQEQVEHSLLDKEIAESELEDVQARVKELEEQLGETQVELEVVKEENARLEGLGDAEIAQARAAQAGTGNGGEQAPNTAPSSLAFRQLEKQNARLKEALLRENENEMKRKIENLEKEVDLTTDLQGDLDNMAVELDAAEAKIEDLRSQLDIAAEAQDMLEELTERNMHLQDVRRSADNEALRVDVEELEALKELADELEESHAQTEKQLQEELDLRDLQLQEIRRRCSLLEDNCVDYETTIGQFRELVISLQADLEQLRQHQATQEAESQNLTSQSQAMLNLNLKLQSTVLKSQVKAIDLELRELEARQAAEHLAIVQPYLPPAFFESDSDAVDALLFFERVGEKVALLVRYIEQKHTVGEALDGTVPDDLIGICEARSKLDHFAALNKRFSAHLRRCPPATFLKMGSVYREVVSTEKRIDAYVEALRKEELQEISCAKDLEGIIAQTEHLAETVLRDLDPMLDLFERESACVGSLDLDLDTIAVAAGFAKQTVAAISREPVELGGGDLDDAIFKPLQNLVNYSRNAKVLIKKMRRRLGELQTAGSAASLEHAQGLETLAFNSSAIASALSKLAADVRHYCGEVRSSKAPLQLTTLHGIAKEIAAVELGKQSPRPLDEVNALLVQLVQDMSTALSTSLESEHVVKRKEAVPACFRGMMYRADPECPRRRVVTAAIDVDAERDVARLTEEVRVMSHAMRTKEQLYQESLVKIEILEKRLEGVKKQAEAMARLEAELAKSRRQERTYEEANEVLQRDLDNMERELDKVKQATTAAEKQGAVDQTTTYDPTSGISHHESNLETSYLLERISSLRSAVRFLRSENAFLKSHDLVSDLDALPTNESPPTPPLTPERNSNDGFPPSRERDDGQEAEEEEGLRTGLPWMPTTNRTSSPLQPESFAVRSKRLLREARLLSCTPRLVDLRSPSAPSSTAPTSSATADSSTPPFLTGSRRRDPRNQLWAEKERARRLEWKVALLREEAGGAVAFRAPHPALHLRRTGVVA
ncbi:hypothetical protein C6P46_001082 [Rhodotorula mucilaginosa]|uniref:CAP-Gly domain-containing protein n=1 Tax=Rhodotorula mucilaginosa TaxID=5537 RepID=A0A9P6VVW5_RHOMI|nr:hypothetical protein C6P46_001082 [Rhodotorula mucilaginosa]